MINNINRLFHEIELFNIEKAFNSKFVMPLMLLHTGRYFMHETFLKTKLSFLVLSTASLMSYLLCIARKLSVSASQKIFKAKHFLMLVYKLTFSSTAPNGKQLTYMQIETTLFICRPYKKKIFKKVLLKVDQRRHSFRTAPKKTC